ncbi:MAG: Asp-tRNA(Asn)/Glu-tRNA(Gln) amidotransferase subunit GatA, partial [Candidatus Omnitrophica bacterium]|nr:Asp-tRNA(Asn)/Glu-tRNA(Gln) amidotransferase subunit GatA [Candidatus Omnitrophota bacterium]
MTMELNRLSAHELIGLLDKGDISHLDICNSIIDSVDKKDKSLNAVVNFDRDKVLERAKTQEGLPVFIKDNICVKDELTTCSSNILKGFRPPYNATVIEKLIKTNAVLMGKTNMDEFAFGSSTETSCYGTTKNPWDLTRIPGGSSGGSAACVAADSAIWALGSDTGGSVRQPA